MTGAPSGICVLCESVAWFGVVLENGNFVCHKCYVNKCMDYGKTARKILEDMEAVKK